MPNMSDHDLLVTINEQVNNMYHRLFGEDQNPGEIESLKKRTVLLEEFKWKVNGALTLLSIIGISNIVALLYFIGTSVRVIK